MFTRQYQRLGRLKTFRIRRWPGVVTIAALAVAIGLLPLPYGYYLLLRLFLCGVCLYFLTRPHGVRDVEKWVLAGLVVLYNPIAPIELGQQTVMEHRQHRYSGLVLVSQSQDCRRFLLRVSSQ